MKAWALGLCAVGGYGVYKMIIVVGLKYFSLSDFRGEWPFLAVDLMQRADMFAMEVSKRGSRVVVSPVPGAMLRWDKEGEGEGKTEHRYGRAIDVMIDGPTTLAECRDIAKEVGFSGIGVYPDWRPCKGCHLDIRPGRALGNPATWAGIKQDGKQVYVAIERGFYA